MSIGDGREGKVRAAMAKGQLGGKLAGLSLPRQIVTIALWPLLEQVMSFICASTSLFLATRMGQDGWVKAQLASGIGVTSYVMWLGFLMQGAVGMGATAVVSRMTGARRFRDANFAANQAAMLGFLAGVASALVMYGSARWLIYDVVELSGYAQEVAMRYIGIGAWVAVFSGVVFGVNAALRGSGDTKTPFFIMLCVDSLNVVFSVLLVAVFGMEVEGLAWGMVGGMAVACFILLGILVYRGRQMHTRMQGMHLDAYAAQQGDTYVPPLFLHALSLLPNPAMLYRIVVIGVPQAVEQLGIYLIQLYVLHVISSLGDSAVGAHNIAIRIESMSFLPGFAIGMAGATLVGQYLGARNIRMAVETVLRCVRYSVAFMGSMGVVFFLFPALFVSIFADGSPQLLETATPVVRVFLLAEPFYAAMLTIKMCLRGAGYTRRVMYVSYGGMGLIRMGGLMLWSTFWPETLSLTWVWVLFSLDMAIEYAILHRMLLNLRWVRKKV